MKIPPQLFLRFFRWYCHPKLQDYIEGDLLEVYAKRLKKSGKRIADLRFVIDVILLFRPGIIKPTEGYKQLNNYGMIKGYFKTGWRNLLRNKGYSFINIGGLTIGMAIAIFNALWIWDEFSYNKSFENYDRIAQVAETGLNLRDGGRYVGTAVTYPLSTELFESYQLYFKNIARASWNVDCILSSGEIAGSAIGRYVGVSFPEMLTLTMLQGTREGLVNMNSILISKSLAESMFGTIDVIGQTLRMNNKTDVTITGVFDDFASNSEFKEIKFFAPWDLFLGENKWIEQRAMTDLRNHFIRIYVEIQEGSSFESINEKVKGALKFDPADQEHATEQQSELYLFPMSRWHLYPPSYGNNDFKPTETIMLVGCIGLFVLLLACVNFMNLSTARSENRAKEVGIRKTIGSARGQLMNQFFTESFLVVFFSFLLALAICSLILPMFNSIASKQIVMPWLNIWFWMFSLTFILFTSLLAGFYPALFLSSFNPIKALKGTFRTGAQSSLPRKFLVVFQYSISIILIIGTVIVYQQIQYAKGRPIGYDQERLLMIRKKSNDFYGKYDVLRNELKKTGVVFEVSESMGPVTDVYSGNNGWDWNGRDPNLDESFATLSVSHTHGKTAGWQFIKGRDFDEMNISDSTGVVINESALEIMGLENPIGEPITWTWWMDKRVLNYKIIGVIKDMVMNSPYKPIAPTIFYLKGFNGTPSWIHIKINPNTRISTALPKIEKVFKKIIPAAPFEFQFADEEYKKKFSKEERMGNMAAIFSGLAVFISGLGLFGLASFMAEQRTKEIGIRKVLGASIPMLWKLLSKDFVVLVIISCFVAVPIGYYFMNNWLQKYEYRMEISGWIFLLTCVGALAITLATVSYQAIRAAMMNPVKSLRSE